MSNMMRRSLDPEHKHDSPLGQRTIDPGYKDIQVRLLWAPWDLEQFKLLVHKAVMASVGGKVTDDTYDPVVVEDAFSGGLNQCLEWVNVVFEIEGVSRGLTHELVRTRKASFAQQSMRHTNMRLNNVRMPEFIAEDASPLIRQIWSQTVTMAQQAYNIMVEQEDVPYQDARTVLPIGSEAYIVAAYPLKVFMDTYAYRACYMFYPEIVYLFREMKRVLVEELPWLEPYIKVSCERTRSNGEFEHMCTFQGWEQVEGHCPLAWAVEENRVWKSRRFDK